MSLNDERNILQIGPPTRPGHPEITQAMAQGACRRIESEGGSLTVWAVLHEDVYETESGDGFYLHVRGIALNQSDAETLAAVAGEPKFTKWHVRSYQLGLENGLPVFVRLAPWRLSEEFTIGHFVAILSEIPPGATASRLMVGPGPRKDGPFVALPER